MVAQVLLFAEQDKHTILTNRTRRLETHASEDVDWRPAAQTAVFCRSFSLPPVMQIIHIHWRAAIFFCFTTRTISCGDSAASNMRRARNAAFIRGVVSGRRYVAVQCPQSRFSHRSLASSVFHTVHRHLPVRPAVPRNIALYSSTAATDQSSATTAGSKDNDLYNELTMLSKRIRDLDTAYYGGTSQISDDEYDALARREAEICTSHPHLLTLIEEESGLGKQATRFGGRVGQLYDEKRQNADKSTSKSKKTRPAAKARIKRHHLSNAPMQSLDNAMDETEALAWVNRIRKLILSSQILETDDDDGGVRIPIEIMAEPKIDGLSLSLRYSRREEPGANKAVYDFIWGATRGDGSKGEDVTEAVRSAWIWESKSESDRLALRERLAKRHGCSIPSWISIKNNKKGIDNAPQLIEVRGEVVLPRNAFEEFKHNISTANNSSQTFSNARNAASGVLLRYKEPTTEQGVEETRYLQSRLQFYAYDIVLSADAIMLDESWQPLLVGKNCDQMRSKLARYGFQVPHPVAHESLIASDREFVQADIAKLLDYHSEVMNAREASDRDDTPYQIDGVVYKLKSFADRGVCGSSSRTPRWAVAHKFPPETGVTRLLDVEVQVGRTGAMTPVAVLEPVDLGGVNVTRASLHNFHYARKVLSDDGGDGTKVKRGVSVLVNRAGDVIPQVVKRVSASDGPSGDDRGVISLEPPEKCPACGSPATYEFIKQHGQKKSKKKAKTEEDGAQTAELADGSPADETGQVIRCSGPQLLCPPRAVNGLAYAYSRTGLDVKGLSKAKLQQLNEEGIVRFPADLFEAFGRRNGEDPAKEEGKATKSSSLFILLNAPLIFLHSQK